MATKQELFDRLSSFVPCWWFSGETGGINEAYFRGIAAVLEKVTTALDENIQETFICLAEGGYLDEHGSERNLTRDNGELNGSFSERIKNISNTTSCDEIKRIVDALLQVGESTIVDGLEETIFLDRDSFLSRGLIMVEPIENVFSIIVDNQVHAPLSFLDRDFFLDREDFYGEKESSLVLFQRVVDQVNINKACGTRFRLIERQAV